MLFQKSDWHPYAATFSRHSGCCVGGSRFIASASVLSLFASMAKSGGASASGAKKAKPVLSKTLRKGRSVVKKELCNAACRRNLACSGRTSIKSIDILGGGFFVCVVYTLFYVVAASRDTQDCSTLGQSR